MIDSTVITREREEAKPSKVSRTTMFALALVAVLFTMCLLYYMERVNVPLRQFYRYVSVIPIIFIAYQFGMKPGIITALFFSTAFLPELNWTSSANWLTPHSIQNLAFILFINTFAYIIADISKSIRTHEMLSSAVRDWGALLDRTSALDEVIAFILEESKRVVEIDNAVFMLRNPLNAQWEISTINGKIPLPSSGSLEEPRLNLAEWLLDQDKPLFQNKLDRKSSFVVPKADETASFELRSLLAQPFRHRDGTLMGLLVLINKTQGDFSKNDLESLGDLVIGGERALEQAGLYARTDYSLARRVSQLAAIQRTARELNATLDPRQIVERTLECALEITDGEAGLISLEMKGFQPIIETRGARMEATHTPVLVEKARELERAAILSPSGSNIPSLLPQASSRLFAPIKRESQSLGLMIVESSSPKIFKEDSRHVLTILADHAAIALENARLFQNIQMEQQRVSLIIHSIADGLFTTDTSGRIITFNPAAERLTGWSVNESVGRSCCEVFGCVDGDHSSKHNCSLLQALKEETSTFVDKFVIRQRSGMKRVIALSIAPLPGANAHHQGSVFLFRDITEEEEMDRLQRELIAAISHELRAPLSNISTITEMLMSEAEQEAITPYAKYLNTLKAQTQRLANFSDRILDVYRLETGRLNLQLRPLPVCLLVEETLKQWQIADSSYTFEFNMPQKSPWIWADENLFQTILNNLIDNAIKYSPTDTVIEVVVKTEPVGFVTCAVRDQGLGVDPGNQTRIFERFYRVDGGDSQLVYGHGLGLYIAKTLVEVMKGQIWVESEIGKGSYFAFTLPRMEESHERENISY